MALLRTSWNQQRKHEMTGEVIPSLGTQDMNTSGFHVSDFVDIEVQ